MNKFYYRHSQKKIKFGEGVRQGDIISLMTLSQKMWKLTKSIEKQPKINRENNARDNSKRWKEVNMD